jgi:pimeloyl-ACP methyl ester carboxylesterase
VTDHVVDVRTHRVRVLEAGAGQPLLLVHGFPLGAAMWRPQLEAVPPGWRFIAPDLHGFGGDRLETPARSMDGHAKDLLALLDTLGIDRAVVCGLSMGGYVAFALLRRAPERVAGLVLCDTRAEADTDEARAGRRTMRELLAQRGAGVIADLMIPRLLGETTRRERPGVMDTVRGLIEANDAAGIDAAIEALLSRPDAVPQLAAIACPTLIVTGDEDTLTPLAFHQTLREVIPGAHLAVLPGAGHLSNLEQPAVFNAVLHQFLERLPRQA